MILSKIFRKQSLEQIRNGSNSSGLKKTLTAFDLTLFGIGAIIGVGIFVLTGVTAAQHSGPAITISYALAALVSIFTAFAYLEMAAIIPLSGSSYNYAYITLGEGIAWIVGWFMILEYSIGSAMIADGWSSYIVGIIADAGINISENFTKSYADGGIINLPAIIIIWFISFLLMRGNKGSSLLNRVLVLIKMLAIIIFIIIAIPHANMKNWENFAPFGWQGVMTGTATVMFSYVGFDALTAASEESKTPSRDLPLSIIISLIICAILYILVAAYLTLIVPYYELNNAEPMAYALRVNGSNIGRALISIGAIAGITTSLIVQIYGQSRMMYSISRDKLIPGFLSNINSKFGTPINSTFIVACIISALSGFMGFKLISLLASLGTLVAFSIVSAGVVYLRVKRPDLNRSFKSPFIFVTGPIAFLSCIYLLWKLIIESGIYPFLIWLFLGIIIYFAYGFKNSALNFK